MPRRPLVPPHVAWPAAIVGLLLTSVGVSATVVVASRSDGGAEVVERPYTHGSDLDTLAAARLSSDALGWTLGATSRPTPDARTRTVALRITNAAGVPVEGLRGRATLARPQRAAPLAIVPVATAADSYRVVVPFVGAGLYDVSVDLRRAGGERLIATTRVTLQ